MTKKKDEILDLALGLFLRHGYKKVTMVDISEAAGISRPTLYAMYHDKQSVFCALIEKKVSDYLADFEKRIAKVKTTREKLGIPFDIWILEPYTESLKHPEAQQLFSEAASLAPEAMQLLWDSFEQSVAAVLKDELGKKTSNKFSVSSVAQICSAAFRDAKSQNLKIKKIKELIETMIAILLRLLS